MRKIFMAAVALMMIALLAGCGSSDKKDLPMKTVTIRAEKSSLEISTPFDLNDDTLKDLGGMEDLIKKYVMKSAEKDGVMIVASCTVFDKEKIESQSGQPFAPDLQGGLLGAVANTKNAKSTDSIKDVEINGIRCKSVNGVVDVKLAGESSSSECEFRIVDFAADNEFWMVMIVRKPNDQTKRIAEAVFNSLKLSS